MKPKEYEQLVLNTLQKTEIAGMIKESAGSDSSTQDGDFVVGGKRYFLEIKKDSDAQMGGTSARYDSGRFELVKDIKNEKLENIMFDELRTREEHIKDLLKFLNKDKLPLSVKKEIWTEARKNGLLRPINVKIKYDSKFIVEHYNSKNVNYIQMGGSGLFYMGSNPANLPVPALTGHADIEIRAGISGTKGGTQAGGVGLRIQARLKEKQVSPFTLDDLNSVKKMIKRL